MTHEQPKQGSTAAARHGSNPVGALPRQAMRPCQGQSCHTECALINKCFQLTFGCLLLWHLVSQHISLEEGLLTCYRWLDWMLLNRRSSIIWLLLPLRSVLLTVPDGTITPAAPAAGGAAPAVPDSRGSTQKSSWPYLCTPYAPLHN